MMWTSVMPNRLSHKRRRPSDEEIAKRDRQYAVISAIMLGGIFLAFIGITALVR